MLTTFEKNGLGHSTSYVYQFIGDDIEVISNRINILFPGLILVMR